MKQFLLKDVHVVERPDLRHAIVDPAIRRSWLARTSRANRYYRTSGGKIDPTLHFERRWVIYNGYAEATGYRQGGTAGCIMSSTSRRPSRTTSRANGKSRMCRT